MKRFNLLTAIFLLSLIGSCWILNHSNVLVRADGGDNSKITTTTSFTDDKPKESNSFNIKSLMNSAWSTIQNIVKHSAFGSSDQNALAVTGSQAVVPTADSIVNKVPNVLLFFVDDLGYGDLGIQGNKTFHSPNVDRLAISGVRFTQWISAESICTPSRGSLLTGRLPIRIGLASSHFSERVLHPISPGGLPLEEMTLAEALKARGYNTHITGKWHLGVGRDGKYLPTSHGFDHFYGMSVTNVESCKPGLTIYTQKSLSHYVFYILNHLWIGLAATILVFGALGIFSDRMVVVSFGVVILIFFIAVYFTANYTLMNQSLCILYKDKDIVQQPIKFDKLEKRLVNDAVSFIEYSTKENKPWFLFMSYIKVHTALFNEPEFDIYGAGYPHKDYINNVAEMDWSVGEILKAVKELGDTENTLVWFASDNGPYLERGLDAGSAGQLRSHPLKGGKATTWEGGIRVPGIVSYPRLFPSNVVTEEPVSTMDILPTTLAIVDRVLKQKNQYSVIEASLPKPTGPLDGEDITDFIISLSSNPNQNSTHHRTMFHYCGERLTAVRINGTYKVVNAGAIWDHGTNYCASTSVCGCDGMIYVDNYVPPMVFNIREDPSESTPISTNSSIYQMVMNEANAAVAIHSESVRNDLATTKNSNQMKKLMNPALYPCCDPPKCSCDKDI